MNNLKKFIIFFSLFLILPQCEKNSTIKDTVVAYAGVRTIDWKLLHRSFELNPQWKKGLTRQQAYLRQLDYLINEKLFAQAAIADRFQQDSLLAGYLKFIQEKELVKELYRQQVASRVEISEQEYQEAYQKIKRKVKFEYIYTPSLSQAEQYAEEFKAKTVDEIHLLDPAQDMKGMVPFIAYGELRPELEERVFALTPGEVSAPLAIDNGYMVIKVIDGQIDLLCLSWIMRRKRTKFRKSSSSAKPKKCRMLILKR